jgi:two-component system, chemotaxis family, sensor histidine kinase and response regulator PixL
MPDTRYNATVLVVEDNSIVRQVIALTLSQEGYRVATTTNGQQALDYLHDNPAPCMIVLDLRMPVMGGEEFLHHRAQDETLAAIPVLLCSGDAEDEGPGLAAVYGISYCPKPFKVADLLHIIAEQRVYATA